MVVDLMKGRKISSNYTLNQSIIDDFSGRLKQCTDLDVHRLVIKMLIWGVLEETFVSTRIQGTMKNISVYVGKGKNLQKLINH